MIKFDKPHLEIKGTRIELLTDLCCIIKSLYDDDVLGKGAISLAVMAATAPEELREMDLSDNARLMALILLDTVERIEKGKRREES